MAQHIPDKKDARAEQELSGHPIYAREEATVAAFITELRAASEPADFRDLHRALLGNFIGCQGFLEGLSHDKEVFKERIKMVTGSGPNTSDAQVRALSRSIAGNDFDRRAGLAVLSLYRTLGDALTWVLLGYRRVVITLLGEGTRVDRLAAEGLEAELAEIDSLWESGLLAIHSDLTTCLQHGDLLVVVDWKQRTFDVREVKASGRAPSAAQQQRLDRLRTLLNEGVDPTGDNGAPLVVGNSPVQMATHLPVLSEALAEARDTSVAWMQLEPYLGIEVYDETNPAGLEQDEFASVHSAFRDETGLWPTDQDVLRYSSSSRRLRDRQHSFSSLAPVCLFPLEPEDVAGLAHGRYDVVATLNAAALELALAERGIHAKVARGQQAAGESFLVAEREGKSVRVPAPVREHVLIELLTAQTLIDQIEWMLDRAGEPGAPSVVIGYAREREHWESYPSPSEAAGGTPSQ